MIGEAGVKSTTHKQITLPPKQIRKQCTELVIAAGKKYDVAPAYIVAHCRMKKACKARMEVMRQMWELGLKRSQIAFAFGRDLRRVRSSVIGGPPRNPNRLKLNFRPTP